MSEYNPVIRVARKFFQNVTENSENNSIEENSERSGEITVSEVNADDIGDYSRGGGASGESTNEVPGNSRGITRYFEINDKYGDTRDPVEFYRGMAERIYGLLQRTKRKSKYYSFVSKRRNRIQDEATISTVFYRANNASFKWITEHGDHYHIVHDCTYSNGSCRCFGKQFVGHRSSRIYNSYELSQEDWYSIIKYHFSIGRRVHHVFIGSTDCTRIFARFETIQLKQRAEGDVVDEGHVEICRSENEVLWQSGSGSESDIPCEGDSKTIITETTERRRGKKRRTEEKTQQEIIEKLILEISKVPLQDFVTTDKYLQSNIRFMNTLSVSMRNALHTIKLKFYNMYLRDYKRFYEELNELPYWDSHNRESFDNVYMSLSMSKKYIRKLLIWQYHPESMDSEYNIIDNEWKPAVYSYVLDLMNFIDRKRGKRNTDVYISPPNAGKTLFFDAIRDFLINCGQMTNWNRNSTFPLQMCGYTRIIFWNEPNYEMSVERNLLKLLGGDSLNVNVKNMPDAVISKTPIIVTSNVNPFPNTPEFMYRVQKYIWKAAPFLIRTKGKKFHPLVIAYLFNEVEQYYEEDITGYLEKYNLPVDNNYMQVHKIYEVNDSESDNESINTDNNV